MGPIRSPFPAFAIAALAVAACGGAAPTAERTEAPAATVAPSPTPKLAEVTVRATEYAFDIRTELAAGPTVFIFENAGQAGHNMALLRLKDGKTFDDLEAAIPKAPAGLAPVVEFAGGAVRAQPGERRKVILDLSEGKYGLISSAPAGGGPEFVTKKMWKGFRVTPSAGATATPPEPQVTAVMKDAETTGVPEQIAAGAQIWKFTSVGTTRRALVLARLEPGKTSADLAAWLKAQTGPAPASFVGGILALSPGRHGWAFLDLTPGEYALFDDAPGSPAADRYLRLVVK